MHYEQIEANEEMYQERADKLSPEGTSIGSIYLPAETSSREALDVFHELMTEHGWLGIEYCVEAIHQEGQRYFDEMADEPEDILDDFQTYKEQSDEY